LEDAALDLLTAVHLRHDDIPAAVTAVRRRDAVIGSLPMVATHGFGHGDHMQYGSEVLLAAGDLPGASDAPTGWRGCPSTARRASSVRPSGSRSTPSPAGSTRCSITNGCSAAAGNAVVGP
jgi:hypothetical protein